MEKVNDVQGSGNALDFGARIYDSRLGRWMSIDPLEKDYPSLSPYNFTADNPIQFIDVDGEKIYIYYNVVVNGQTTVKAYEYGSKQKPPRDKFVRQSIRTLNSLKKNNDKFGMINKLTGDDKNHIAIQKNDNWNASSSIIESGKGVPAGVLKSDGTLSTDMEDVVIGLPPDLITWSPNSGLISPNGKETQSPAIGLLHEIGHKYYEIYKPEGDASDADAYKEGYDTAADKWIINNVETASKKDWHRKSHFEGYFAKTRGPLSRHANKYGKWGQVGKVRELKKGNVTITKPTE